LEPVKKEAKPIQ
jgi:hypothetical protein